MKRRALGVYAVLVMVARLMTAGTEAEPERPGVSVLPPQNKAESLWWAESGARLAQQIVYDRLVESDFYRVIERSELEAKLQENRLWLTGEISPAGAVKLSRVLGVRYLLTGTLTEYGLGRESKGKRRGRRRLLPGGKKFIAAFVLRLMDGETGALVWADSGRGEASAEAWRAADPDGGAQAEATMFDLVLRPVLEELADRLVEAEPLGPEGDR
jgi:curli biogenesis system outer membrane secretion channel CsgG